MIPDPTGERAAAALADYIRIDTTNPPGLAERDPEAFRFIRERYERPLGLEVEELEGPVLLLKKRAGAPATGVSPRRPPPVLFLGHADVVPAPLDERDRWTHPPFAGEIADGFLWGRGALDNKASLICLLEGLRALVDSGGSPSRDVVIALMPDEETGGHRGVRPFVEQHWDKLGGADLVIDEGSCIASDVLPGALLAAVAVGEKCQLALKLTAEGEPGHASMPHPSRLSAVARLARALFGVTSYRFPPRILEPMGMLLDRLGGRVGGLQGALLRQHRLFGPLLAGKLSERPSMNAMIRHTVSATILRAGEKLNVVPGRAEALLDARLLPGTAPEEFLETLKRAIDDPGIAVEVVSWEGDTPITPARGPAWEALQAAIESALPGALVAPVLCPGMTDSRFFARKGLEVLRFLPFTIDKGELARVHGIDERISLANLEQGPRFYAHLLRSL